MFPFLTGKSDNFVFDALIAKSAFYANPSLGLDEDTLKSIVVDGSNDNGVDCILTDGSSMYGDMVFVQCKYYEDITFESIKDAINKMISAYKALKEGRYELFNEEVVEQYERCLDEMQEGANVRFCFATSAKKSGINNARIKTHFNTLKGDLDISLDEPLFEQEVIDSIEDSRTARTSIERDKLIIDETDNILEYGDGFVVNVSANSLKKLYGKYHNALLVQNLRYFVKNKTIDNDVAQSIAEDPNNFWYKNNGITIICDDCNISGKELRMQNFSIINGGQTTKNISVSAHVNDEEDFYLMCRVIKNPFGDEKERQQFVYDVSKATNSQKAIKPSDLKANAPEQLNFAVSLHNIGILYKTKRGMDIPKDYKLQYKNCDLPKVGKIALAGFFIMPGTSRNKPSVLYDDSKNYYNTIFNKSTSPKMASIIKDLLYVDYYFDKKFISEYKKNTLNQDKSKFSGNCRTLCVAFTEFLAKFYNNEFSNDDLRVITNANVEDDESVNRLLRTLSKSNNLTHIFDPSLDGSLDIVDEKLEAIFDYIINFTFTQYTAYKTNQNLGEATDETNWLKKDSSFFKTLKLLLDQFRTSRELGLFKPLFVSAQ